MITLPSPTTCSAELLSVELVSELRVADFVGPKTPQRVGMALAVAAWLYFTEGNMIYAIGAYMAYKRMYPPTPADGAAAAGGAAGAAAGGVQPPAAR